MQDTDAKQRKAGATVHLPREHFEPVDVTFGDTVSVVSRECRLHRLGIAGATSARRRAHAMFGRASPAM
jgi:hypothetical protein